MLEIYGIQNNFFYINIEEMNLPEGSPVDLGIVWLEHF